MVLNVSENVGRASGGFLGGITNNPGTIIIIAIVAALVLFRGDIRKAFGSASEALGNLGNIELPGIELPDINLPDINFPEFNFPDFNFPTIEFPSFDFDFANLFGSDESSSIAGETIDSVNESTIFIPEDTTVNPDGTVSSSTPPLLNLSDEERESATEIQKLNVALSETFQDPFFGDSELVSASNEEEFRRRQALAESIEDEFEKVMVATVESFLPTDQTFEVFGTTTGGFIFENPIDTLSEVLKEFPQLSASQAADFLEETGGTLLPSEVEFFDADIRNISGELA